MKSANLSVLRVAFALLVTAAVTVTLVSWDFAPRQAKQYQADHQFHNDTVPGKQNTRDRKVRDLDDAIAELDEVDIDREMQDAMKEVQKAMKEFDGAKLQREINNAMREVDMAKVKVDMDKAMKEIDMEKIKLEIDQAMKEVDMEKVKVEVTNAMKEIDMEKIMAEVKTSLEKVDWKEIQADLDKLKLESPRIEKEMEKVREELKGIGPKIEKELEAAKVEIAKAKAELKEYKVFVDGLEADGLINKKEAYTLIHEDGKLTINGTEASSETYKKNQSFLKKHKKFSIRKTAEDFDIDMD